jgi:hypothetical protein
MPITLVIKGEAEIKGLIPEVVRLWEMTSRYYDVKNWKLSVSLRS